MSNRPVAAGVLVSTLTSLGFAGDPSIRAIVVGKEILFHQTGPETVGMYPASERPSFEFQARVIGSGVGGIGAPVVSGPIADHPGHNGGVLCHDEEEDRWDYGPDCHGWDVATRQELDALFGDGVYTFAVEGEQIQLNLAGDLYPAEPPAAELAGGAWRDGEYHVSFGRDVHLRTSAFGEWCGGVLEAMVLSIYGPGYASFCERFSQPDCGEPRAECVFDGASMLAGGRYQIDIEFTRVSDYRDSLSGLPALFDGAFAAAFYTYDTELHVNVGPECVGDFNGDTKFDLADITGFIGAFVAMNDSADVHIDGLWDLADLVRFVTDFNSQCEG